MSVIQQVSVSSYPLMIQLTIITMLIQVSTCSTYTIMECLTQGLDNQPCLTSNGECTNIIGECDSSISLCEKESDCSTNSCCQGMCLEKDVCAYYEVLQHVKDKLNHNRDHGIMSSLALVIALPIVIGLLAIISVACIWSWVKNRRDRLNQTQTTFNTKDEQLQESLPYIRPKYSLENTSTKAIPIGNNIEFIQKEQFGQATINLLAQQQRMLLACYDQVIVSNSNSTLPSTQASNTLIPVNEGYNPQGTKQKITEKSEDIVYFKAPSIKVITFA